jgi:hypothetical protein
MPWRPDSLGLLGDGARVTIVRLHRRRLDDVAAQDQGGFVAERVQHGVSSSGIRIMSDSLMLFQPPMDEPSNMKPSWKESASTLEGRDRRVLLLALRIGEAEVHPLDVVLLDHLQYVVGHLVTCSWVPVAMARMGGLCRTGLIRAVRWSKLAHTVRRRRPSVRNFCARAQIWREQGLTVSERSWEHRLGHPPGSARRLHYSGASGGPCPSWDIVANCAAPSRRSV